MFKYTVGIFWLNVSSFLYDFSSIQRKLYTIFLHKFFSIRNHQDMLFKLLTLSTNSVTKKIIFVRTVYFYNSGSVFATKICDRVCTQSKKLYVDILTSLDWGEMLAGKWCIPFWVKMEKTGRNLNLLSLKTSLWKRSWTFFHTVYPN